MSSIYYVFASLVFLVAYSHAGMGPLSGPMGPGLMGPGPMGPGPMGPGPMGPAGFIKAVPHPGPLFDGPAPYPVGPVAYDGPFPYGFPYTPYYGRGVAAVRNVAQDYHREDARRTETQMVVPTPYGGYFRKA